jgi:hypothetical protein
MSRKWAATMLALAASVSGFAPAAEAGSAEKTLYTFGADYGDTPSNGLASDEAGNLYGTVEFQGANGFGYVFRLSPKAGGGWTYSDVWDFTAGYDGAFPEGLLSFDGAGNLYGTTVGGGNPNGTSLGVVFELQPGKGGAWSLARAYDFTGGADGSEPRSGVVADDAGNVYGTANQAGALGFGTLFELTPAGNAGWKQTIIHQFQYGADGGYPSTNLTLDKKNDVYGSVQYGGTNSTGYVFEFKPARKGWKRVVLHNFGDGDAGGTSYGSLVVGAAGDLYGATALYDRGQGVWTGSVFELTRPAQGGSQQTWPVTTLYQFSGGADGGLPENILFDKQGTIYGNAAAGGADAHGAIYALTPSMNGARTTWSESVLYSFAGGADGCSPGPNLISDKPVSGRLFGVTGLCGANLNGTIFSVRK